MPNQNVIYYVLVLFIAMYNKYLFVHAGCQLQKKDCCYCCVCFCFFLWGGGEGMVMYTHEVETKEKYKLPEIKK